MDRIVIEDCSIITATKVLGKKWTIFVLSELLTQKELYFSELQAQIKGKYGENISARVLTDCLSNLEDQRIINRQVKVDTTPVRVSYSLTEKGKDFELIFAILKGWGIKWGGVQQKVCSTFSCVHNTVPFVDIDHAKEVLPYITSIHEKIN
ncbi:MAG: HTH-type transcriptional regulator YodB [Candidatus Heimdallarchaeota archaeon LC_3]|nr:MAG: HTH-type transcriptional regulator YodB [Candidatus Heimdallarchaeota archaeon LC_3]